MQDDVATHFLACTSVWHGHTRAGASGGSIDPRRSFPFWETPTCGKLFGIAPISHNSCYGGAVHAQRPGPDMFHSLMSSCVGFPAPASGSSRLTRRQRIQILSSEAPSESEAIARLVPSEPDGPASAARCAVGAGLSEIALSVRRCESGLEPEVHTFQQPLILIGSNPDADLVLPDRRLEGMHLYLQKIE